MFPVTMSVKKNKKQRLSLHECFSITPVCSTECFLLCDNIKKKKMRGAEGEGAGVITPRFCFLFSSLVLYVLFFSDVPVTLYL